MAEGVVKFAAEKLGELALQEVNLQSQVGKEVSKLRDDLEWLRAFMRHADRLWRNEASEYMDVWVRQTREVAFDAEDLLEEYFHKGRLHFRHCLDVPSLLRWVRDGAAALFVRHSIHSGIESLGKRLEEIKNKQQEYNLQNIASTWSPSKKKYSGWYAHPGLREEEDGGGSPDQHFGR